MSHTEKKQEKSIDSLIEQPNDQLLKGISEKTIEQPTKKNTLKRNKFVLGLIFLLSTLLIIYFGLSLYFTKHFYFGSKINSINVSFKTADEAKLAIESNLQNYTLNVKERGNNSEEIKASNVGLKCTSNEAFNNLKSNQNPFKWVLGLFNANATNMTVALSYDNDLLNGQLDKLSCFNNANIVEPKNASFQYENDKYIIVKEVLGTKVDKNALYTQVTNSLLTGKTELNLDSSGCYVNPEYNSKSEKTLAAQNTLNKYVSSKITYSSRGINQILDGSTIKDWLKVDDNLQVTVDSSKVKAYVATLANAYGTVGSTRSFVTTGGGTINIDGGDYGWSVDKSKETQDLIQNVEDGKTVTKEPAYSQTTFNKTQTSSGNDIGATYVEVDIEKQHLWFYKNGSLVVQGDVVTGNVSIGHGTPTGIYSVKYKERDTHLVGQGYDAPVSFWMPFNGGIGLHDASWRHGSFGGDIYLTDGSHGCVNCPYDLASALYNNIDADTPVVCY